MRVAVVQTLETPLEIRGLPIPTPEPGQIPVQIEASGMCHTDIHAARGDRPVEPTAPSIPGHEGVGIVEQLGDGVTAHQVPDRKVVVTGAEEIALMEAERIRQGRFTG